MGIHATSSVYFKYLDSLTRKNRLSPVGKMEAQRVVVSAADINRQNIGKKRKSNIMAWKDRARKALRDAGQPYTARNGQQKEGKHPPKEVSGRTVYLQCFNIMSKVTISGGVFGTTLLHVRACVRLFTEQAGSGET